jgi:hypothetical protein
MSSLQNKFISETYTGLLHSDGALSASETRIIYDGTGQASALSVGLADNGASITGLLNSDTLKVGDLTYPFTTGNTGDIIYQKSATEIDRISKLPSSSLADVTYSSDDIKYIHPSSITLKKSGLVSNVFVPYQGDTNYKIASNMFIRNAGSGVAVGTGSYQISKNNWTDIDLNSVISVHTGENNPIIAILSINITDSDNTFQTTSDQTTTFYATGTTGSGGDNASDYNNLLPILSLFAASGRESFSAGAQFMVPILYGTSNENKRFRITCDKNPTSTDKFWKARIRLIGFLE